MSLTPAALKVQSLAQKIIPLPYHLDLQRKRLTHSESYYKKLHIINRTLFDVLFLLLFVFVTLRLTWLVINWKTYTIYQMEEAIIYSFVLCLIGIYIPIFYVQSQNDLVIFHMNQTFILAALCNKIYPKNYYIRFPILGKQSILEIFIYGLSLCFIQFLPAFFAAPFAITYCPLQLMFGSYIYVKLTEGFIYIFITTHAIRNVFRCSWTK